MGSITPRKRKDGSTGYTAQIRITKKKVLVFADSETFNTRSQAAQWMKKREVEFETLGARATAQKSDPTLAEAIDRYINESKKQYGKTKEQVLNTIKNSDLGEKRCSEITSQALIEFGKGLKVQPQTVGNYLSHLAAVMKVAKPAWGYPLDPQAMDDARIVADKLGLIGKSKERSRRPTLEELDKLLTHFTTYELKNSQKKVWLPMCDLVLFALFSTRREAEIFRISWEDLNAKDATVTVRDMKHPGEKIGNDVQVELPPRALNIILKRKNSKSKGIIFPFNGKSVGTNFADACAILGIEDLHFHDLRHEGVTCLFEQGKTIPQVASVSGHRSWGSLKRYTHIKQSGDKYAEWHWLAKLGIDHPPHTVDESLNRAE